jgi:hypothetical protein
MAPRQIPQNFDGMIASTALPIKNRLPLFRRFPECVADLSREFLLQLRPAVASGKEMRDQPDPLGRRWKSLAARYKVCVRRPPDFVPRSGREGGLAMFKRTRLISLAAIAAVLLSGPASAMAATPDHPKKKMTHASKPVPKSASKTSVPGPAPAKYPSAGPY